MITLQLTQGASRDFALQAVNLDGSPARNVFQIGDVLTTFIWIGDSTNHVLTLAPQGGLVTWTNGAFTATNQTSWIDPIAGTFQVTFNNGDTSTLAPLTPDIYRIQTTSTRQGRTAVILDGRLQITATTGTAILTDLVTQDYLQTNLYDLDLTNAQLQALPQLTAAASRLIRRYCNRYFNRQTYDGLYTLDWPSRVLNLRQFPVNGLIRVRTNPTQVFNVTNTSGANQQAYVTLTYTGNADIPDIPPLTTGMRFTRVSYGIVYKDEVLLTGPNITFQGLMNSINLLGNGWKATIANSLYSQWPTADLRQGVGPSVAIGTYSQQGFWIHVDDTPAQIDQDAGLLLLDASATGPWTSPRFGAYSDTGYGDLDIGGGHQGIRVVYDAGWDVVPEDVQQACVETIRDFLNLLNLDQRIQSETDGAYSYELANLDKSGYVLPPSVIGKVNLYRNIRS
jgi:hypothetical protein